MRLKFQLSPPKYCAPCDYPDIRIGALRLFARSHSNGETNGNWVIASWHRAKSITWRWSLHWNKSRKWGARKWVGPNGHGNASISIPIVGELTLNWQPHMWRSRKIESPLDYYYNDLIENSPNESCPNCGESYDDADFDFQICHFCWYDSEKNEFTR